MPIKFAAYKQAFSLIEISFLIIIIGIILSLNLEYTEYIGHKYNIDNTYRKLKRIKNNLIASNHKNDLKEFIKNKYFYTKDLIIADINYENLNLTEYDVIDAWNNKILIAFRDSIRQDITLKKLCNLDFGNLSFAIKNDDIIIGNLANKCNNRELNIYHNLEVSYDRLARENIVKFNDHNNIKIVNLDVFQITLYVNFALQNANKQLIYLLKYANNEECLIYEDNKLCYRISFGSHHKKHCFKEYINPKENISLAITRSPFRIENIHINNQEFKAQSLTFALSDLEYLQIGGNHKNMKGFNGIINQIIISEQDFDKSIYTYLINRWSDEKKLKIIDLDNDNIHYKDVYLISYGKNQNGAINLNKKQFFKEKKLSIFETENIVNHMSDRIFNHLNHNELKKFPDGLDNYDDITIYFNIN